MHTVGFVYCKTPAETVVYLHCKIIYGVLIHPFDSYPIFSSILSPTIKHMNVTYVAVKEKGPKHLNCI